MFIMLNLQQLIGVHEFSSIFTTTNSHLNMYAGKFFYVKVIEVRNVLQRTGTLNITEPVVSLTFNGQSLKTKTTSSYPGREWWDTTFKFTCKHAETDWVYIQVRDKAWHIFGSDWVGDIQLNVKEYSDGKVHQSWFQLANCSGKRPHKKARGFIHLAFQLVNGRSTMPFSQGPMKPPESFEEWLKHDTSNLKMSDDHIVQNDNTTIKVNLLGKKQSQVKGKKGKEEERPPAIAREAAQVVEKKEEPKKEQSLLDLAF